MRLRQQRAAGSCVYEVSSARGSVFQEKHVGGLRGDGYTVDSWLAKFFPSTGGLISLGLLGESGVIEAKVRVLGRRLVGLRGPS